MQNFDIKLKPFLWTMLGLAAFLGCIWWTFARPVAINTVNAKVVSKEWVAGHAGYSTRTGNVQQYIPPAAGYYKTRIRTKGGKDMEVRIAEKLGEPVKAGENYQFKIRSVGIPVAMPLHEVVELTTEKIPRSRRGQ